MVPEKYQRRPFFVDAVRVSESNMEEVAKWCDGTIEKASGSTFVKVRVNNPTSERSTQAHAGNWVVYMNGSGFKVFTHKSFKRTWSPVFEDVPEKADSYASGLISVDAQIHSIGLVAEAPNPAVGVHPIEVVPPPANPIQGNAFDAGVGQQEQENTE